MLRSLLAYPAAALGWLRSRAAQLLLPLLPASWLLVSPPPPKTGPTELLLVLHNDLSGSAIA